MDKKTQQIVGAGAAVLVLIAGFMLVHKKPSVKVVTDTTGTSTEVASGATEATGTPREAGRGTGLPVASSIKANSIEGLEAADQAAGNSVAVTNLKLGAKTWVVVYDTDEKGQPSWPMGAGLVWPGNDTFVSILMRKTEVGKTYYVALVKDDGSMKFDLRAIHPSEMTPVVSFKAI